MPLHSHLYTPNKLIIVFSLLFSIIFSNALNSFISLINYRSFGQEKPVIGTTLTNSRKYIGETYDAYTGYNYLNARYYNSSDGKFISQDPVYWELGITKDGKAVLTNPQSLNSYSYANNNPITLKDPSGRVVSDYNSGLYYEGTGISFNDVNPISVGLSAFGMGSEGLMNSFAMVGKFISESKTLQASKAAENGATLLKASEKPSSLFHYTSDKGLDGILTDMKINPSTKAANAKDARYGDGQYFSDIQPGLKTNSELSRQFITNPFQGDKFKNFVEISTKGLNVFKGRDGVFMVKNSKPLDISKILKSSGSN